MSDDWTADDDDAEDQAWRDWLGVDDQPPPVSYAPLALGVTLAALALVVVGWARDDWGLYVVGALVSVVSWWWWRDERREGQ